MSITFTSYVAQITNLMVTASSTDPAFITMLPGMIDYSEGRLYRELDLPAARITDASAAFSSGARTFTLPTAQGTFLVVERISAISSAGASATTGTRNPITFTSPDYIDGVYPSAASSNCGLPEFAARVSDTTVLLGPAPDQPYVAEVYGTFRPTALSSGNSSTWLTQNVPELFIAASMVFASGFMRNFGAGSDDPRMAVSWEQTYKDLFTSANVDSLRMKYQSQAWTNQIPNPVATPARV